MGFSQRSGRGIMSNRAVSVSTTAIKTSIGTNKESMTIQNIGNSIVYLGGSGVTSSAYAIKLVPTQIFEFQNVKSIFNFYAICAAGTSTILGVAEYT